MPYSLLGCLSEAFRIPPMLETPRSSFRDFVEVLSNLKSNLDSLSDNTYHYPADTSVLAAGVEATESPSSHSVAPLPPSLNDHVGVVTVEGSHSDLGAIKPNPPTHPQPWQLPLPPFLHLLKGRRGLRIFLSHYSRAGQGHTYSCNIAGLTATSHMRGAAHS